MSTRPMSTFHNGVPFMSKAWTPCEPNHATTIRPSVAGDALAYVDLMCRRSPGTPSNATRSHSTLPVRLSIAYSTHLCGERSSDESPPPYRPGLNVASGRLLMALVTKIRSPQTTGLECASPGMGVRHRMFSPVL